MPRYMIFKDSTTGREVDRLVSWDERGSAVEAVLWEGRTLTLSSEPCEREAAEKFLVERQQQQLGVRGPARVMIVHDVREMFAEIRRIDAERALAHALAQTAMDSDELQT